MWVGIWLALGAFAAAATGAWIYGRDRIYVKAGVALAAWALFAIAGGDVYWLADCGNQVELHVGPIQWFGGGMALLSFFVLLLYRFDEYPPQEGL